MRLKALLVDDEARILENLELVLPWQELEIEVAGKARNGREALEMVEAVQPDLVLCDIRMPVLDGIQFLEAVNGLGLEPDRLPEVVMLTGYQDFEYARSVMRLGVKDYILKPIDYEELTAVLERLAGSIRTRRREKTSEEQILGQAMDMAYEKLLYDMLMGYGAVFPYDMLAVEPNGLEQVRYFMLLADFPEYGQRYRVASEQDRKLWNFAVRNVLKDTLMLKELRHAVLQTREGEWCVLIELPLEGVLRIAGVSEGAVNERVGTGGSAVSEGEGRGVAELLQRSVLEHVKLELSIGVYLADVPLDELPKAFKLLQRRVHLAGEQPTAILVCREEEGVVANRDLVWETMDRLVSAVKGRDQAGADAALAELNRRFHALPDPSLAHVERQAYYVVLHLLREMRGLEVVSPEQEQGIWRIMEQADRVKDLLGVVGRIVEVSFQSAAGKKSSDVLMIVAKDYVHRHLSRDLGIDELAELLGISSSYFSLLFKQYFGCTFVEYVTGERMEMAKSMLLLTDKSVTEIGRLVGYTERRYFTKVFLKHIGEIPSEYREKRKSV